MTEMISSSRRGLVLSVCLFSGAICVLAPKIEVAADNNLRTLLGNAAPRSSYRCGDGIVFHGNSRKLWSSEKPENAF
jgi:hypothetical protein